MWCFLIGFGYILHTNTSAFDKYNKLYIYKQT